MIEMPMLLDLLLRSALVGTCAVLLLRCVRSRPAAAQAAAAHAGLLALLLLPLLALGLPRWNVPLWSVAAAPVERAAVVQTGPLASAAIPPVLPVADTSPVATPAATVSPTSAELPTATGDRSGPSWSPAWLYVLPMALLLATLLLALRRLARLRGRATRIASPRWQAALQRVRARLDWPHPVELRVTTELGAPVSWGLGRPVIVIDARTLQLEQGDAAIDAVLAHELAHIARRDWLWLLLGRVVVALHWCNPLAWWLAARAQQLREEAADDAVLARGGVDGSGYAALLVQAARLQHLAPSPPPLAAHGMAAGSLKARVKRVLDAALDRAPARRGWTLACGLAAVLVAAPLAALVPAVEVNQMSNRLAVSSFAASDSQPLLIAWTLHPTKGASSGDGAVRVQLSLSYASDGGGNHHSSSGIDLSALRGLDAQQLVAATAQDVQFRLEREAGTLACQGQTRAGGGAGTCSFTPDGSYLAGLERVGLARPDGAQQLQLALSDVRMSLVELLRQKGYADLDIDALVEAGIHGVSVEWLQALDAIGYKVDKLAQFVEFRIFEIDAGYIRELAAIAPGYANLRPAALVEMRIHGVSASTVRALEQAGYRELSHRQLVEMAIHGASPKFIGELSALGYRGISAAKLVEMRIHGVKPDWIEALASRGYRDLEVERLIEMRIHGVRIQWLDDLAALGYRDIDAAHLVEMRIHGVDAAYIRDRQTGAAAQQGRPIPVEKLVRMKIMGD